MRMVGTAACPRVLHVPSNPSNRAMPSRDDGSTTHHSNHPAASVLERHVPLLAVVRPAYSPATPTPTMLATLAVVFLANLLEFALDLRFVGTKL